MDEQSYEEGRRAVWGRLLDQALAHLGYSTPLDCHYLVSEREDAISMLRQVCEDHGDNDWDEGLSLADIIEKHLWRHLEAEEG